MAFLGGLHKLLNRVGNTVNNDVVRPIRRDALVPIGRAEAPIIRGVQGAVQAANLWDAESRGNNLINQTNQRYHFTPQFKQNLDKANPQVVRGNIPSSVLDNQTAGGEYGSGRTNAINITNHNNTPQWQEGALVHEGLHRTWDKTPQIRQQFIDAYSKASNPELRSYLNDRLTGYKGYNIAPSDALMNISHLPSELQNEANSYAGEYYLNHPAPPPLKQYYSQFYGASQPAQQNGVLDNFHRLLRRL